MHQYHLAIACYGYFVALYNNGGSFINTNAGAARVFCNGREQPVLTAAYNKMLVYNRIGQRAKSFRNVNIVVVQFFKSGALAGIC